MPHNAAQKSGTFFPHVSKLPFVDVFCSESESKGLEKNEKTIYSMIYLFLFELHTVRQGLVRLHMAPVSILLSKTFPFLWAKVKTDVDMIYMI